MPYLGRDEDERLLVKDVEWVESREFRRNIRGFWYNIEGKALQVFEPIFLTPYGWAVYDPDTRKITPFDGEEGKSRAFAFAAEEIKKAEEVSSIPRRVIRGHVFDFYPELGCWMNLVGSPIQIFPPNKSRKSWMLFGTSTRWKVSLSEEAAFAHAVDLLNKSTSTESGLGDFDDPG